MVTIRPHSESERPGEPATQDIIALGIWVDSHCRGFEIVENDGTVRPITNIEMHAWMAAERIGLVDV